MKAAVCEATFNHTRGYAIPEMFTECSLLLDYQHKRARVQVTIIAPGLEYSTSSEILSALASSRSTCGKYQDAGNKEIRQDGVKVIYEDHNAELPLESVKHTG